MAKGSRRNQGGMEGFGKPGRTGNLSPMEEELVAFGKLGQDDEAGSNETSDTPDNLPPAEGAAASADPETGDETDLDLDLKLTVDDLTEKTSDDADQNTGATQAVHVDPSIEKTTELDGKSRSVAVLRRYHSKLRAHLEKMRSDNDVKHTELRNKASDKHMAEYSALYGDITKLGRRIELLETSDEFDEAELQKVFTELQENLSSVREKITQLESERQKDSPVSDEAMSPDTNDVAEPKTPPGEPPQPPVPPSPEETKNYEKRLELRNDWKGKKAAYMAEYEAYQKQQTEQQGRPLIEKWQFWKKENMPESLVAAKQAYADARHAYSGELEKAVAERANRESDKKIAQKQTELGRWIDMEERYQIRKGPEQVRRAMLANRFVIQSAHEQLAIEKEFVPKGTAAKTLEGIQSVLKKHGKKIRYAGYAITVGGAAVSGAGVLGIAALLGARVVSGKVVAGSAAAGAGSFGFLSSLRIDSLGRMRDSKLADVRKQYSSGRVDEFENEYLSSYKKHEQATRDHTKWVAAGALAGGVAGAAFMSSLDEAATTDVTPTVAPEGPAGGVPDMETPVPPGNVRVIPLTEQPVPETPPIPPVEGTFDTAPVTEATPGGEGLSDEWGEGPFKGEDAVRPVPTPEAQPEHVPGSDIEQPSEDIASPQGIEQPSEAMVQPTPEIPTVEAIEFTFQPGDKVNTFSEAAFETWKANPSVLGETMSQKEFLSKMWKLLDDVDKHPLQNHDLLEASRIASGDFDEVGVDQTINLRPFFERLKTM